MFRVLRTAIRTHRLAPLHGPRPRLYTSRPPPSTPNTTASPRISRLLTRSPRFLHPYIHALSNAPISHITSFLLLHELTAIIPLFSLAAFFHYTHWLPSWFAEGVWVLAGVEKFGRWFRKKGWIAEEERREAGREVVEIQTHQRDVQSGDGGNADKGGGDVGKIEKAWNVGEGGVRIVVEFATAYAITKALLVPRIMFSVWATPAFARWTVAPVTRKFKSLFGKGGKKKGGDNSSSGGKGGSVNGGALPNSGNAKEP